MNLNLSIDDVERKFNEDLERAKALSLEEAALDKFRQERRKASLTVVQPQRDPSPVYAKIEKKFSLPARSADIQPTPIQIKPRPRPGAIHPNQGVGLVPPPLPPKKQTSNSTVTSDLINFRSPVSTKPSDLEDSFLQELDLASARSSLIEHGNRNALVFPTNQTASLVTDRAIRSFPVTPTVGFPPLRSKPSPAAFNESLINKNLIDLGRPDIGTRYSILDAFDPLLSSEYSTDSMSLQTVSTSSETDKSSNKNEELMFSQEYDPFDYFLGLSQRTVDPPVALATSVRETIYEVLTKEQSPVKPSAGNKRQSIIMPSQKSKDTSLKIVVNKVGAAYGDVELVTFAKLLCEVRSQFKHDDPETNPGYVVSKFKCSRLRVIFKVISTDEPNDGVLLYW